MDNEKGDLSLAYLGLFYSGKFRVNKIWVDREIKRKKEK